MDGLNEGATQRDEEEQQGWAGPESPDDSLPSLCSTAPEAAGRTGPGRGPGAAPAWHAGGPWW